jgi:co-chaperonin GroES (HSP10)
MNLRPLNDWIVVRVKPLEEKVQNGIIILKESTAQTIQEGEVLRVGPGRRNRKTGERIPVGVGPGAKVAFFRWNREHQQGQQLTRVLSEMGENLGLLREADILFTFTGSLEVG